MATKQEKEELIEILKFTPRTYKISLWGYGGEKVMGTVSKEVWDYCNDHQVNLVDIAWSDEDTVEGDMGLDLEKLPFTPGSWYECDDIAHVNGVSKDAGTLQIEDENGNTVIEKSLDDFDGCSDDSLEWSCGEEAWVGSRKKGEVVFIGSSNEKGTFFEGDIELRAPFDITKLTLQYDEVDGEEIINTVLYDGEEIENYGGSTDGKSSDMNMVILTDDKGNWERYEPEEKDWGHPEIGVSPNDWEKSPKLKFKKVKPTIPGYYSVNWGYGSTYGSLYWNGENFGDWEYGKFHPVNQEGVVTWQGYNWDTSSWANQPPEPPEYICKKCGWTGKRDELKDDDNYDSHCPECDSKKVEWIDYDPESKKGLANRKKYCKEWDPALALERIAVPNLDAELDKLAEQHPGAFPTAAQIDELEQVECVQCDWKGSIDETNDNDGEMACPECGEPVEFIDNDEEETMTDPMNPWTSSKSNEAPTEIKSKWWTVKTYHKKNCEQHEYFTHPDWNGPLKVTDGFRWCTYNVETNDGEFPKFEFTEVPGGNGARDSLDLNSLYGSNIESSELVEMFDGGCWGDWEFPEDMPEEEQDRLREFMEENGTYALEDDEGWMLDETEVWVWGPLEVTDDEGNVRIVIADEDGNMVDFKDE